MRILVALVSVLAGSCDTPDRPNAPAHSPGAIPVIAKALPRFYWPLDYAREQKTTSVPGLPQYQVLVTSICLNDSAVSNQTIFDNGPALDISHNYESDLIISKNGRAWQQARLTKAIFQGNTIAQALGPLSSLTLSFTSFSGYRKPDFLFYTRLGVPDSDVFVEADIALRPGMGLRLVKVHEPEPLEAE